MADDQRALSPRLRRAIERASKRAAARRARRVELARRDPDTGILPLARGYFALRSLVEPRKRSAQKKVRET
jgi:hypothetical protein